MFNPFKWIFKKKEKRVLNQREKRHLIIKLKKLQYNQTRKNKKDMF